MRCAWLGLLIFGVLLAAKVFGVAVVRAQSTVRTQKVIISAPNPPQAAMPPVPHPPRTVMAMPPGQVVVATPAMNSGNPSWRGESKYCTSPEEAEDGALRDAWSKVVGWMRTAQPPLDWTPPLDFVRRMQKGRVEVQTKDLEVDGQSPITAYKGTVEVELSPKQRSEMLRADHRQRVRNRMMLLGAMTAGLVGLLMTLSGYIFLDERTKGFYTGRLRLLAFACLTAVAVGVLIFFAD